MALNLGVMSAAVTLDDADYKRKLSGLESASSDTFKKIAQYAAGYLTFRGINSFVSSSIKAFSDLENASWNFEQVFQKIPAAAAQSEAEMQKLYKLSETTSKKLLSDAANQLQAFGFSAKESLDIARQASERGIDLASYFGGNQADAVSSIVRALTGETEGMKKFGVVVQQGSKEFAALVENIKATTGATDLQAKSQAIFQTILKQTANAAGDYRKEGSTIAQQQMDIGEATRSAQEALGRFFAQGVSPAMDAWNKLLLGFVKSDTALQNTEMRTVALAAAFALLAKSGGLAKSNLALSAMLTWKLHESRPKD